MSLYTDQTPRHCSRCLAPLTDPASRECGVGPVCRNKDNHLYAKTIQANLPAASAIVLGTTAKQLPPELSGLWESFMNEFLRQMARSEQQTDLMFDGADFRESVRKLDYMLSYRMQANIKERLVKTVRYLGYPGLAAVLSQAASTSPAKLYFQEGRVFLSGRSNKYGFRAMRRIPGIVTPRYRGDSLPYSAPAVQVEAFIDVVMNHWPLYEGDPEAIRQEAQNYISVNPEEPEVLGPVATITKRTEDVTVKFEWVRGAPMYDVVNRIKAIPAGDRKYDPATKVWSVKLAHLEEVKAALSAVFDTDHVNLVESAEATPEGHYAPAPRRRGSRRGQNRYGYWRR